VHAIIAFHNTGKTINSIVANGKRFMAYNIVTLLKERNQNQILQQLQSWVNNTQKEDNKLHAFSNLRLIGKNAAQKNSSFKN